MADYKALAQTIIGSVGGVQNVRGLTHCVTRLRFMLADPKLADTATLEKTDGVIKVIEAGGQYQVVVGSKVTSLYDTITEAYGIQGDGEVEPAPGEDDGKDSAVSRLLGIMSSILMPTLPVAGALFGGTPFEMDYYNTFFGIPVTCL